MKSVAANLLVLNKTCSMRTKLVFVNTILLSPLLLQSLLLNFVCQITKPVSAVSHYELAGLNLT